MKRFLSAPRKVAVVRRATVRRKGLRRLPMRFLSTALYVASQFALTTIQCHAAPTISQQIQPAEGSGGDPVTATSTVQKGGIGRIELPPVEGLQVTGTMTSSGITIVNNSISSTATQTFVVAPTRAGDFTIPAFKIH